MTKVAIAISRTLNVNMRLRPRVSPKCAMTIPPRGRTMYPAAKMPKVWISRTQSLISAGKNSLPITGVRKTKTTKS